MCRIGYKIHHFRYTRDVIRNSKNIFLRYIKDSGLLCLTADKRLRFTPLKLPTETFLIRGTLYETMVERKG
jgi:hypothetical protein